MIKTELTPEEAARTDHGIKKYSGMEYVCEDCGRTETFDGGAVKTRSPMDDEADCAICTMNLVDREKYWNGEVEPDKIVTYMSDNDGDEQ